MTSGVPLLAASFASKFDTIGPYVGFGSLIAVVAMAILVFAQGRELQRLREWAGTSPERLDALEDEVRNGGITRVPASPAAPGVARPGTLARHPAAVGAPGAPHAPGAPVTAAAGGALGAPPAPPAPGAPVTGASTTGDGAPVPPVGPRPVPPRPGTPGAGQATRAVPAASAAGGPRAATPAGQAASTARERSTSGGSGSRRPLGQIIGLGVVALVVLVALLFAVGVIGGGGDSPADKANKTDPLATKTTPKKQAPRYSKTNTRVTVLNGSGTAFVAKTVSDRIDERLRFPMGTPGNYQVDGAQPTQATTTVQYATGSGQAGNREAAQDIAKSLGLRASAVRAMTSSAKVNAPDAKVIVIVGQDLAAKYGNEPNSSAADPGTGASTANGPSGSTGTTSGGTGTGAGTTGGGTASTSQSSPASPSAVDGAGTADSTDGAGTTSGGGVAP